MKRMKIIVSELASRVNPQLFVYETKGNTHEKGMIKAVDEADAIALVLERFKKQSIDPNIVNVYRRSAGMKAEEAFTNGDLAARYMSLHWTKLQRVASNDGKLDIESVEIRDDELIQIFRKL